MSIYRLGQPVVTLCLQGNAGTILLIPGLVGKIHQFNAAVSGQPVWTRNAAGDGRAQPCPPGSVCTQPLERLQANELPLGRQLACQGEGAINKILARVGGGARRYKQGCAEGFF